MLLTEVNLYKRILLHLPRQLHEKEKWLPEDWSNIYFYPDRLCAWLDRYKECVDKYDTAHLYRGLEIGLQMLEMKDPDDTIAKKLIEEFGVDPSSNNNKMFTTAMRSKHFKICEFLEGYKQVSSTVIHR